MSLRVIEAASLAGPEGIGQLRQLQSDMRHALAVRDYSRVRQLDKTCAVVLDAVIAANQSNRAILLEALTDLKDVYRQMLAECDRLSYHQVAG